MLRPELCGKWQVLETLLREWRKDRSNKVLIFTKSVKLLEMLDFHLSGKGATSMPPLRSRYTETVRVGYGFVKLDGSTKQSERA